MWGMEMAIERRLMVSKQIKLTTKDERGVDDGACGGPATARLADIIMTWHHPNCALFSVQSILT
jgi:hypothetical protein